MTRLLGWVVAVTLVWTVGATFARAADDADAAAETQLKAMCDDLLVAAVEGDTDAFKAVLDTRGFVGILSEYGSARLLDADGMVQALKMQSPPEGTKIADSDIQVYGLVAVANLGIEVPDFGTFKVVAFASNDGTKWVINCMALLGMVSENAPSVQQAKDLLKKFEEAAKSGDAAGPLEYLADDHFVAVAADPVGMTHVFTTSQEMADLLAMAPQGEDGMGMTFGEPTVIGADGAACTLLEIKFNFGGMELPLKSAFIVAKVNQKWVIPAGAVGISFPE
jgi:hypothetical protein